MQDLKDARFRMFVGGLLLALAGCAPSGRITEVARAPEPVSALPAVPQAQGPLDIQVAYPSPLLTRPDADSTFIFGTVGDGRAQLTINDIRVPLAPNGAFLAYLPVPEDGSYRLVARRGRQQDAYRFAYHTPAPPPAVPAAAAATAPQPALRFTQPRLGTVVQGKDTLASGSEIAYGSPAPGADRRWFFPIGARLPVVGREQGRLRLRLSDDTEAWTDASAVELDTATVLPPAVPIQGVALTSAGRYVDVRLPVAFAPFLVEGEGRSLVLTVYGRQAPATLDVAGDALFEAARWAQGGGPARLQLTLSQDLWGYMAFYEADGTLVLRVRRPPEVDPDQPLRGLRIMVDAGHPPGGAIGPTGLTEPEANLAISRRLADLLRAGGAEVIMTRTSEAPLVSATSVAAELWGRVDLAVAEDVDVLVSVHNNAFPDGVNPFESYGSETYYYHSFSAPLAEALIQEIAAVTGLPNLGAKQRSLALVRPTWMPSTLTESLFMMFPQQENALKQEAFLDRLAEAHRRGIEAFLRGRR